MKRQIIKIDEDKCNGCGVCIPNCPEGALQIVDGKAKLVKDLLCDGLGACLGHCPEGAISFEEREAESYSEREVIANVLKQGEHVLQAHLTHLQDHNETEYLKQALDYLKEHNIDIPITIKPQPLKEEKAMHNGGCPGSKMRDFSRKENAEETVQEGRRPSELTQWPIQLHLVSPAAPYFHKADILIAADCVAFTAGDFHKDFLQGKKLAIGCPKLDEGLDMYQEKITALMDQAKINTLTVMTMEVPCCQGLLHVVKQAAQSAARKVPVKHILIGLQGDVLSEEWV